MKAILFTTILLAGGVANAEVVSKTFEPNAIRKIELQNTSGDVSIKASSDGTTIVTADKIVFDKGCQLKIDKSGDALVIAVKDDSSSSHSQCEVNFELVVPKQVAMSLKSGSGAILVAGTKGSIDVKTGSGDVGIDAEVEELSGSGGSGSFKVTGLTGSSELRLGSGNVKLVYSKVPEEGKVKIKTGSGNVEVTVPGGSRITTDLKAGSGKLTNEVGDTPGAKFSIGLGTGSGNLTVKKG